MHKIVIEMDIENADNKLIQEISKTLTQQVGSRILEEKYAGTEEVLKMVGAGLFIAASLVAPGLPRVLKPFLDDNYKEEREAWKRFNLPYLKRTLERLEKQRLVEIKNVAGKEMVTVTTKGERQILRLALDNVEIKRPGSWNGRWFMVTYDVPKNESVLRNTIREYLRSWGFYQYQESVYLHAYPCKKQIDFLKSYLGAEKYIRLLEVSKIEADEPFRQYFGV